MSFSLERRLSEIEKRQGADHSLALFSAVPLPDDPDERRAFIKARLADGTARIDRNVLFIRAPILTTAEWLERAGGGYLD